MKLAMAKAQAKAKVKHIYSTSIIYDCHLQSSKYFYNTGHRCCERIDYARQKCLAATNALAYFTGASTTIKKVHKLATG